MNGVVLVRSSTGATTLMAVADVLVFTTPPAVVMEAKALLFSVAPVALPGSTRPIT